jgi:phenylpropionate dioxygenase-like ring-hydroxylating dioxygenase large terminal subunit
VIRNQWYVVLESSEVRSKPVGARRLNEDLVFWRDRDDNVTCAVDRCPHRGAALSGGDIEGGRLTCPFHGFEYAPDGACKLIPANGRQSSVPAAMRLQVYPTHEAHGLIWIWWGEGEPDADAMFFDNIDDSFVYASVRDSWEAHYSRVIENQLDVVHLPFVHRNSIGRGNRTLVDGPLVRWKGDRMLYTHVFNRVDDGTPPRKPGDIELSEARSVHLELILPNLWQNYISENVRIVAAFVQVDDDHTVLYLRFYQRFLRLPVLGRLVARLAMPFNLHVAHEDRRVVQTQVPKASGLKIGEIMIQGDLPVIEYRRRRDELIATAKD